MKLIEEMSLINDARQRLGSISLEFYRSLFPPELRLFIIYECDFFFFFLMDRGGCKACDVIIGLKGQST